MKGVIPALLTIIDKNGQPNAEAIEKLVNHVITNCKADGLYVCGSTGENFLLTHEQKKIAIKAAANAGYGRADLIAHIGSNVVCEVYDLATYAADCGYTAVSAVTPFYYNFTNSEIIEYYLRLADKCKIPLLVYNIPTFTSVSLSLDDIKKLFAHGNIVGVKNSAQDYYFVEKVRSDYPDKIILSGVDQALLSAAILGTNGAIGSTYNVIGHWARGLFDAVAEKDISKATEIQHKINIVAEILLEAGIFQTLKEIVAEYGIIGYGCLPPFEETKQKHKDAAKKILKMLP